MFKNISNNTQFGAGKSIYNIESFGSTVSNSSTDLATYINSLAPSTVQQPVLSTPSGQFSNITADTITTNMLSVLKEFYVGPDRLLQIMPSDVTYENGEARTDIIVTTKNFQSSVMEYTSILLNVPYLYSTPDYVPNASASEAPDNYLEVYDSKFRISGPFTEIQSQKVVSISPIFTLAYLDRVEFNTTGSITKNTTPYDRGIAFEYVESGNISLGFYGYSTQIDRFVFYKSAVNNGTTTYDIYKNGISTGEVGTHTDYNVTRSDNTTKTSVEADVLYTNTINSSDNLWIGSDLDRTMTINSYGLLSINVEEDSVNTPGIFDFNINVTGEIIESSNTFSGSYVGNYVILAPSVYFGTNAIKSTTFNIHSNLINFTSYDTSSTSINILTNAITGGINVSSGTSGTNLISTGGITQSSGPAYGININAGSGGLTETATGLITINSTNSSINMSSSSSGYINQTAGLLGITNTTTGNVIMTSGTNKSITITAGSNGLIETSTGIITIQSTGSSIELSSGATGYINQTAGTSGIIHTTTGNISLSSGTSNKITILSGTSGTDIESTGIIKINSLTSEITMTSGTNKSITMTAGSDGLTEISSGLITIESTGSSVNILSSSTGYINQTAGSLGITNVTTGDIIISSGTTKNITITAGSNGLTEISSGNININTTGIGTKTNINTLNLGNAVNIGNQSTIKLSNYTQIEKHCSIGTTVLDTNTSFNIGGTLTGTSPSAILVNSSIIGTTVSNIESIKSVPLITTPNANTVPLVSNMSLYPANITIGALGNVTNSSTLYIDGATTNAQTNHSIYSKIGDVFFGGVSGNANWNSTNNIFYLNDAQLGITQNEGNIYPYLSVTNSGQLTGYYIMTNSGVVGSSELFLDGISTHIICLNNTLVTGFGTVSASQPDGTCCYFQISFVIAIISGTPTIKSSLVNFNHNDENNFSYSLNVDSFNNLIFNVNSLNANQTNWNGNICLTSVSL